MTYNLDFQSKASYGRDLCQGQRSVASKDAAETNGRTDSTDFITLPAIAVVKKYVQSNCAF